MNKRVLRTIPYKNAGRNIISQAKRINYIKHYIKAETKIIDRKITLIIYVYDRNDLINNIEKPIFQVFITKNDYITRDLRNDNIKWLTGRLESLIEMYSVACGDIYTENVLNKYFSNLKYKSNGPLSSIIIFQYQILNKRLKIKHNKIKKRIDNKMKEVPKLPKDFLNWIDKEALVNSRYIYYTYSRKKYVDGYCTYCHNNVKVTNPKHRKEGICPVCGCKITFLAIGKAKKVFDIGYVAILQKTKYGFVERCFLVNKGYYTDFRNPDIKIFELTRNFYEGKKVYHYEYRNFKNTGEHRWCEGFINWYLQNTVLYSKNIDIVLKDTVYKYSAMKMFAQRYEGAICNTYMYLRYYLKYPFIEYIVKAGLYNIAYNYIYSHGYGTALNSNGKTLKDILRVPKEYIKYLKDIDGTNIELYILQKALENGVYFKSGKELREFNEKYNTSYSNIAVKVLEFAQYSTIYKVEKYIEKNMIKYKSVSNFLLDWNDYIKNAKELGYDIKSKSILYPNDFKKAHDRVAELIRNKKDAEQRERYRKADIAIQKMYLEYNDKYYWSNGKYTVIVPKNIDEIQKEGSIQNHCVGGYALKVANKECVILFLRKAEEINKAFYTIELKNDKLIQCRGYSNKEMTDDIKNVVKSFITFINKKNTLKYAV